MTCSTVSPLCSVGGAVPARPSSAIMPISTPAPSETRDTSNVPNPTLIRPLDGMAIPPSCLSMMR